MNIDERLARRLVDVQFPEWAGLPIRTVERNGWDNRTFRLGEELSVRLPSGDAYALAVDKEQRWLPVLAPRLPVPTPVARGVPGLGYPYSWSVYRWLDGEVASAGTIHDLTAFATSLAEFLVALREIDNSGGPAPGEHNWLRGAHPTVYADQTHEAVATLGSEIPRDEVLAVWEAAAATVWDRDPVWFHGDVAVGNLLVRNGKLASVIDFGTSGVGDPACDLVIAWTLLTGDSRDAFRRTLGLDPDTWARGRGWALWKSLITLVGQLEEGDTEAEAMNRLVLRRVLADYGEGR